MHQIIFSNTVLVWAIPKLAKILCWRDRKSCLDLEMHVFGTDTDRLHHILRYLQGHSGQYIPISAITTLNITIYLQHNTHCRCGGI